MTAENPIAKSLGDAAQSLRDTAKWLVSGVAATAAGVFAGSSLTSLGSLDPSADMARLIVAGIGVLVGFAGLGIVIGFALRVLQRESVTFRGLVNSDDGEVAAVRAKMQERYAADLDGQATLAAYLVEVDRIYASAARTAAQTEFLKKSETLNPTITADAGFFIVQGRFNTMLKACCFGVALSIVGFGAYAWAANPPKPPSPATPAITIPGLRCQ